MRERDSSCSKGLRYESRCDVITGSPKKLIKKHNSHCTARVTEAPKKPPRSCARGAAPVHKSLDDDVVAVAAVEHVLARAANEGVVAVAAAQRVVAGAADDQVVAVAAVGFDVECAGPALPRLGGFVALRFVA